MDPEDETVDGVGAEEASLSVPSGASEAEPVTEVDAAGSEVVDVPEEAYPLVSGDDVFLPNPRTIVGLEDYYALKENLSWTNATQYWPDIGQTDWVVLYESAILTSETPTVSIVKRDAANLTITGGKNLIFMDSSELTINQIGGVSEIYYDPTVEAKINLNITDGVSALSQFSLDTPSLQQTRNQDGSRTIKSGSMTINYQTGDEGKIFLNDMITGKVVKAEPTFTLQESPIPTAKVIAAPTEGEYIEHLPHIRAEQTSDVNDGANAVKTTRNKPPMTYIEENILDIAEDKDEGALTHFKDDVIVEFDETDIVRDYFSLPAQESWKYAAEVYRASEDVISNIATSLQDSIQKTDKNFEELREGNVESIEALLAMQQWEELVQDEIMDLFYVD